MKHKHAPACFRSVPENVIFSGVLVGVSGQMLVCGMEEDHYYPLAAQLAILSNRYFGIDQGAFDEEEAALKLMRQPTV